MLFRSNAESIAQGAGPSGPGYLWSYGVSDPDVPISTGTGVPATGGFPNGEDGYYVVKAINDSLATIHSVQRAQYVEDRWQVHDNLLLSLGLRNDQFTNYNSDSDVYIRQSKPQWAP